MCKTMRLICLVCLWLCWQCSAVFAQTVAIYFHEQAVVQGPFITLGDLADISGNDVQQVSTAKQFVLGSAPLPGASLVLSAQTLKMRLPAQYLEVVRNMPATVTVTAAGQPVSGELLANAAITAIRGKIGTSVAEADLLITPTATIADLMVPVGDVSISIEFPYGIRYRTPTVVQINVLLDNKLYVRRNESFWVKQYQAVVVADKLIGGRQILLPEDLRYERVDVSKLTSGFFTSIDEAAGLMIRYQATPGMVIAARMLEKPLLVKMGTTVAIVVRGGQLEVQTLGLVLQNGAAGDVIRVRNVISKKVISARVLDAATVLVEM